MYPFRFSHFECFGSEEIGTVKGKSNKKENVSIIIISHKNIHKYHIYSNSI